MMLQEASDRVMISGVHRKKWSAIFQMLKSFARMCASSKGIFCDVLVVNVDYRKMTKANS